MRYFVTVGERTFEIELAGETILVDGEPSKAELANAGSSGLRRLLVDGESHRLIARRGEEKGMWELHLDGIRILAEVVDERTRTIRAMTARSQTPRGPRPIKAPMPGMVVRISVQPGERVGAGQGVVTIEAMKMENELRAEAPGIVSKIAALPGTAVEKGAILVEFEHE